MKGKCLIINAKKTILKFFLYELSNKKEIVNGYFGKIGDKNSFYILKYHGKKIEKSKIIINHTEAIKTMFQELLADKFINDISEINGIGHCILNNGEHFAESIIIDDNILNNIKSFASHDTGEILSIESLKKIMPSIPQVALFEDIYIQTMSKENSLITELEKKLNNITNSEENQILTVPINEEYVTKVLKK